MPVAAVAVFDCEAGQAVQMTPIGTGPIPTLALGQLFADGAGRLRLQRCSAELRVFLQLAQKSTDLDRYICLVGLLDHNEKQFYRTVMSDSARFLPIVY